MLNNLARLSCFFVDSSCQKENGHVVELFVFSEFVPSGYVNSLLLKMTIYSGFSH